METKEDLLSAKEIAPLLYTSVASVLKLFKAGQLSGGRKICRDRRWQWVINKSDFSKFLASNNPFKDRMVARECNKLNRLQELNQTKELLKGYQYMRKVLSRTFRLLASEYGVLEINQSIDLAVTIVTLLSKEERLSSSEKRQKAYDQLLLELTNIIGIQPKEHLVNFLIEIAYILVKLSLPT